MKRIWKEEGYEIARFENAYRDYPLFADVYFKREDGKPVSFKNEWCVLKHALKRQKLFGFPIKEDDISGCAHIRVIDQSYVTLVGQTALQTRLNLQMSYWYMQGDKRTLQCFELLKEIEMKSKNIKIMVRRSKIGTPYQEYLNTDMVSLVFKELAVQFNKAYDLLMSFHTEMDIKNELPEDQHFGCESYNLMHP